MVNAHRPQEGEDQRQQMWHAGMIFIPNIVRVAIWPVPCDEPPEWITNQQENGTSNGIATEARPPPKDDHPPLLVGPANLKPRSALARKNN